MQDEQPVPDERAGIAPPLERTHLLLALLTYRLRRPQLSRFLERLRFRQKVANYVWEVRDLRALAWRLNKPNLNPSRIYRLLHNYSSRAVASFSIALDSEPAYANVLTYLQRLRWIRPHIKGSFFKEQGLPSGPAYREMLDKLLDARLDGRIRTTSEEEAMAEELLEARQKAAGA